MTGFAARVAVLGMLCGMVGACTREPVSAVATHSSMDAAGLSISFKVDPDPPRAGENKLEVSLAQAGVPVTDAAVTAEFYMPAMPSMNMPEMRSKFPLQPMGGGVYRGNGSLIMGGTWNVTITASRAEEKIGSGKYTVIAK
ncbi:MAG: FixH family protein [Pseudomonadota bacterium]